MHTFQSLRQRTNFQVTLVILRSLSLSTIISFFPLYSLHIPYSSVLWEFLLHLSSTVVHVPYDPARSEFLRTEAIETIAFQT